MQALSSNHIYVPLYTVIRINFVRKKNFRATIFSFISMGAIYSSYIVILEKIFRKKFRHLLWNEFFDNKIFTNYGIATMCMYMYGPMLSSTHLFLSHLSTFLCWRSCFFHCVFVIPSGTSDVVERSTVVSSLPPPEYRGLSDTAATAAVADCSLKISRIQTPTTWKTNLNPHNNWTCN